MGVTDEFGKFFDLQFVNDNIKLMKTHHLELVTVKDAHEDNMSFGNYLIIKLPTTWKLSPTKNNRSHWNLNFFKKSFQAF